MRSIVLLVVSCVAAGGCQGSALSPLGAGEEIGSGSALGRTIERDTRAPVQTDSLVYHATAEGEWRSVNIAFRYRNDTGRTIYLINCHGGLNIALEKRVAGSWELAYSPVLLMCLSEPITIAAGDVFESGAGVRGALPGLDRMPAFEFADLDGEYRLVWWNLVHRYDSERQGFGDPVSPLYSNPFLLVAPTSE